jgi:predicted ribosome quality control (RQC) complex YloA/Tae2 family protein
MQPIDALTIKAILTEARPLIVNRKVDKINQTGRDEIILTLRGKTGISNLLISAQAVHGRICLIQSNLLPANQKDNQRANRNAPSRGGAAKSVSSFCLFLRKHLTGATLLAVEQPAGERIVDLVFSCIDEVGTASLKILSAEIMGKHSNLIFWEKNERTILSASHNVTQEMSRQREVCSGLKYERPPAQDKANLFSLDKESFDNIISAFATMRDEQEANALRITSLEQWLLASFTGAGRNLYQEIILAARLPIEITTFLENKENQENLWQKIESLRLCDNFHPQLFFDLSRYSVLGWYPNQEAQTRSYPSVNDLVEDYYAQLEANQQARQLKEYLQNELSQEIGKLTNRIEMAEKHVLSAENLEHLKQKGDLILTCSGQISPGQEILIAENYYEEGQSISIELNANLNSAQNAQLYYRQYAKGRAKSQTAVKSIEEAQAKKLQLEAQREKVLAVSDLIELKRLKEQSLGKKPQDLMKAQAKPTKTGQHKVLSAQSSDGWTIYVGRNRQENDYLLSKLSQPNDLWFHVLGQGGAHVLIRIPSSKQEPPLTTITEAAQIAARLSKAGQGNKVRVVYTQCKFVKKIAREKPGLVRYEQERTIEVDTAKPMPQAMKQLFAK